jgi:hypothetical protein
MPTTSIVTKYDNLTGSSVGVGSTRWDVEHRESTQGQCLSWTQKPQNQRGRFHLTKVGGKEALSGWRETLERERGRKGHLCHHCTSLSLDREEPSRSPTLATGTTTKYVELSGRSWIHTLVGGAPRLYTR